VTGVLDSLADLIQAVDAVSDLDADALKFLTEQAEVGETLLEELRESLREKGGGNGEQQSDL